MQATDTRSDLPATFEHLYENVTVSKRSRLITIAALLAICIGLLFVPTLGGYYVRIANLILIYILLGLGLNIVVGYAGLLDLGFVAFYAVGAYTYGLLAGPQFGLHFPILVILVIAACLGATTGALLGIPVLRLRGDYLAIVTLGFGEIIRVLMNNLDGITNGPRGLSNLDKLSLFGVQMSSPQSIYWLLLVVVILAMIFVYRLERSILGRAWMAIREDQDAAVGIGIDKTRVKLIAFSSSAAIGAIAGVLFSGSQRFISPESFSLQESIFIVLVVVIGGIGNIVGVVAGAVALIVLPELLREYAEYRMLIFGLLLVVLIIVRPGGIVPAQLTVRSIIRRVTNK
jgi:branched-chain amino acid transport system permease protein